MNRELKERAAAIPDVVSAAETIMTPVSGSGWDQVWAGQGAATLLYGLKPNDAVSLITAAFLLALAGLLARYAPTRRAAGLDPMQALREE